MADLIAAFWQDWLWLATAAFSIVTTLIALVYVLGSILMNDKMKGWAKMELFELFYSAIIITVGLFAVTTVNNVVQGAIGMGEPSVSPSCGASITWTYVKMGYGNYQCMDICGDEIAAPETSVYHGVPSCHVRLGMWLLHSVFDETSRLAMDIYIDYLWKGMLQELSITVQFLFEKAGVFSMAPWRGFYTMGNTVRALVFDWAIKIMMLAKFQEFILRFIAIAFFPAFFVIGALLRTFSLTRRLGGLMLAMAIALYFIFPAFYSFGALVALDIKNQARSKWMADPVANPHHIPDPPIANSIYSNGTITMIGGDVAVTDIYENYERMDSMDSEEYLKCMETGDCPQGVEKITPDFDLSKDPGLTDEQKKEKAAEQWGKTDDLLKTFSKKSKLDRLMDFAWDPNGPVDSLARLTFFSVFFSLFGIFATIAGIRSLSMTFGGDIEIAGLTRLI